MGDRTAIKHTALIEENTNRIERTIRRKFGSACVNSYLPQNLQRIAKGDVHRVRSVFAYVNNDIFDESEGQTVDIGGVVVMKQENVSCVIYYDPSDNQGILSGVLGRRKKMELSVPVYLKQKTTASTNTRGFTL